ncbi:hypothetical protein [Anaeromyxobacter paludicola]|uniref:Nuclease n=1 Tax=Anaeromyxobacter paludicola TaxID=2918171 RepID=A0ABM7X9R6_9BACT|nr:hypothetical protein [Anaeromyxobacter paludicola]BDG08584.1 hypothetical protein AMPC_16970 [Anaeromyxobacter paludicola]
MKYDRRITERFERFILQSEALRRFLGSPGALGSVPTRPPVVLDAQLRLGDLVTVYAGATKVLDIRQTSAGKLRASAAATYVKQAGAGVFGTFSNDDLPTHLDAWYSFFGAVNVDAAWVKEGTWQAWLARRGFLGLHEPWAVLDREAQPEGVDRKIQQWLAAKRAPWKAAMAEEMPRQRNAVQGVDPGASPDFLAVLPTGDLGIIEVKHGSNGAGIYYGPVQVGGYVALWQELLAQDRDTVGNLNAMIEQRQRIGLLSSLFPRVRTNPKCIPLLVVGAPKAASPVWGAAGLLDKAIRAAKSAGAPLHDLEVWVATETDMRLRNVTKTLAP